MAKGNGAKRGKKALPEAEAKAMAALEAIRKSIGDKPATDAQKAQLKAARDTLGKLKFARVATARVPKAVKAIAMLGNLGTPAYPRTEKQVDAILGAIGDAVKTATLKLRGQTQTAQAGFALPEE